MNAHGTVGQLTIGAPPPNMFFAALHKKSTGPTVATSKATNDKAIFAALADLKHNVALVNATATATVAQAQNGWEATMVQLFGGATEYRPPSGTFVVRAAAVYLAAGRCMVLVQEAPVCSRACPCPKLSCIRHYMCTTGTPE